MNKDDQEAWLSISEAAKYLRVSKDTLRRWEKKGILKAHRSPTNRRFYKRKDLERFFSKKEEVEEKKREVMPQTKNNLSSLIIIGFFTTFIVIAAFLTWLLLTTG